MPSKMITCCNAECRALFPARSARQRYGYCIECRRAYEAKSKTKHRSKKLTEEQNEFLRRLERITCRVGKF